MLATKFQSYCQLMCYVVSKFAIVHDLLISVLTAVVPVEFKIVIYDTAMPRCSHNHNTAVFTAVIWLLFDNLQD